MYARDIVFARDIVPSDDAGEKTIILAVSGMLWSRSLVMVDPDTKSLWSQLLGRAMSGPLEGSELDRLPSTMTDWKTWRKLHPDSTVLMLSRTADEFMNDQIYTDLEEFVVGIAGSGEARAWPFDQLAEQPLVNDEFAGDRVVVFFNRKNFTARVYDRQLNDRTLSFETQGETIVDRETGSVWDAQRGRAISGTLEGEQLKPLAAIVSFREAWNVFHPETEVFTAGG